jgi:uncharacterized membrane-anchored protein YhcB (DUF1043 family)
MYSEYSSYRAVQILDRVEQKIIEQQATIEQRLIAAYKKLEAVQERVNTIYKAEIETLKTTVEMYKQLYNLSK